MADLFLFCYERDFMMSLSEEKQSKVIEAFSSTSRYLDDLLNIDDRYFDGLISQIYPSSETKAPFFGFALVHFRWVYFMQNI